MYSLAACKMGGHGREFESASDVADRQVSGWPNPSTPRHSGRGVRKVSKSSGFFEQKSTGRLISRISSD